MFFSGDVAEILEISKSTLFRYQRENPELGPPRRWNNIRQFRLKDIYATYEFMLERGRANFDKETLEKRIVLYSLALATLDQRRRGPLMQTIAPIVERFPDLERFVEAYQELYISTLYS